MIEISKCCQFKHIADFMIFQIAQNYLRIRLKARGYGSQNEDTSIMVAAFDTTKASLQKAGQLNEDIWKKW